MNLRQRWPAAFHQGEPPLLIAAVIVGGKQTGEKIQTIFANARLARRPEIKTRLALVCSVNKRDAKLIALQICGLRFFHVEP